VEVYSQLVNNIIGSHKTLTTLLSEHFSKEDIHIDNKKWNGLDLNPNNPHKILIKLAQFKKSTIVENLRDIVESSQMLGSNILQLKVGKSIEKITSEKTCVECGAWLRDIEPKHFHMGCPFCKRKGCAKCNNTGLHPLSSSVYFSGLRINLNKLFKPLFLL